MIGMATGVGDTTIGIATEHFRNTSFSGGRTKHRSRPRLGNSYGSRKPKRRRRSAKRFGSSARLSSRRKRQLGRPRLKLGNTHSSRGLKRWLHSTKRFGSSARLSSRRKRQLALAGRADLPSGINNIRRDNFHCRAKRGGHTLQSYAWSIRHHTNTQSSDVVQRLDGSLPRLVSAMHPSLATVADHG
jgi:hypothetical protein